MPAEAIAKQKQCVFIFIHPRCRSPALTEVTESIEVEKLESDTMVAKRTSDDWPTLTLKTLRFNALLSIEPSDSPSTS